MGRRSQPSWIWRQIWWPRSFAPDFAVELLDRIAADREIGTVVFEARAHRGSITHFVGVHPHHVKALNLLISSHVPATRLTTPTMSERPRVKFAGRLKVSHPALALNVDRVTAISRAVLAGLATATTNDETVVLQVILGARLSPRFVSPDVIDPTQHWFDLLVSGNRKASTDTKASLKNRVSLHGCKTTIRIGATANSIGRTRVLLFSVLGGLRVAQAAGVRINIARESPLRVEHASLPWRWPLQLSSRELVSLVGWPLDEKGDAALPGRPPAHPKQLVPIIKLKEAARPFAETTAPGINVQVGIGAQDSLQHTVLLGPTASGKSTAMLAMILDSIHEGRGLLVIDPKADLVNDVLARVPESRADDVVVIDPTDPRPVGLNPLRRAGRHLALTADSMLAVFKELSSDSWGPRTEDVLLSALMTLALHEGGTLTMLPRLLTDQKFRRSLTRGLDDDLGLGSFWANYEAMSPQQKTQVIAPTMSRLRQFLLRPQLRAVLGQSEPEFDLAELFTQRKIVLVSLNRGQIGTESARLLGSLIVSQLWPLILARASLPQERRRVVNIYIDEVQDYLALPTDLEDAFSQARGLGVGFTVAHQYRRQLPPSLRSGIDANARNKVIFGLNAEDAGELARQSPALDAQDFMYLPRFGVYTSLVQNGESTGWFSARTLPAESPLSDPVEMRARSAQKYGRDLTEIEAELRSHTGGSTGSSTEPIEDEGAIGRRRARGTTP